MNPKENPRKKEIGEGDYESSRKFQKHQEEFAKHGPVTEKARITKDLGKTEKEISGLEKKLGNADFLARAPEDVVAEQKARLVEENARKQRLLEALQILGGQS